MKNVINFPKDKVNKDVSQGNYSHFLENYDSYKNVLPIEKIKKEKVRQYFNKKKLSHTLKDFRAYKASMKNLQETFSPKKSVCDNVSMSFLWLNSMLVVVYLGVLFSSSNHLSYLCSFGLADNTKNMISIMSCLGVLFSIYQASKVMVNILNNIKNSKAINDKHVGLLLMSFLYTCAFGITPLYLLALNLACHQ